MATESSNRRRRPRVCSSGNQICTHQPGVAPATRAIPVEAKKVLQRECRRLHQALAVLTCLRTAAEHEIDVEVADVATVACDLLDKALYELALAGFSGDAEADDR